MHRTPQISDALAVDDSHFQDAFRLTRQQKFGTNSFKSPGLNVCKSRMPSIGTSIGSCPSIVRHLVWRCRATELVEDNSASIFLSDIAAWLVMDLSGSCNAVFKAGTAGRAAAP